MKKMFLCLMAITLCCTYQAKAQFVVSDPMNFAGNLANSIKEIVQTSTTASNMINNFKEVQKVYNQGKEYYDALKSVHNLVKDARKVQQTILMVGDISDIYIKNFQKMMSDPYFSIEELGAIGNGYAKLLEESGSFLTELKTVTTSNGLSLSDKERMDVIDRVYNEVREYKALVQYFTNKNISVSYLRAKKKNDTDRIMQLYGSPSERYW
ncbi:MAG: DUF4141 domain-containing protein [Dysgonamonadaceae bacterium]|nr:DUF4141 domain-containing protein [Dysgonamonadaceae bacterium]